MTIELNLYGYFNLYYMSIIEGLHTAIRYYVKFGVVYELMHCGVESKPAHVFMFWHLWSLLACDIPVLP